MARVQGTLDYSGFKRADMVIEAALEDIPLKQVCGGVNNRGLRLVYFFLHVPIYTGVGWMESFLLYSIHTRLYLLLLSLPLCAANLCGSGGRLPPRLHSVVQHVHHRYRGGSRRIMLYSTASVHAHRRLSSFPSSSMACLMELIVIVHMLIIHV